VCSDTSSSSFLPITIAAAAAAAAGVLDITHRCAQVDHVERGDGHESQPTLERGNKVGPTAAGREL
jgi:hypothetical protein